MRSIYLYTSRSYGFSLADMLNDTRIQNDRQDQKQQYTNKSQSSRRENLFLWAASGISIYNSPLDFVWDKQTTCHFASLAHVNGPGGINRRLLLWSRCHPRQERCVKRQVPLSAGSVQCADKVVKSFCSPPLVNQHNGGVVTRRSLIDQLGLMCVNGIFLGVW